MAKDIMLYNTRAGDVLDWICWRHYGQRPRAVELVLEANPGLAEVGPLLPRGIKILLPSLPYEAKGEVSLWD